MCLGESVALFQVYDTSMEETVEQRKALKFSLWCHAYHPTGKHCTISPLMRILTRFAEKTILAVQRLTGVSESTLSMLNRKIWESLEFERQFGSLYDPTVLTRKKPSPNPMSYASAYIIEGLDGTWSVSIIYTNLLYLFVLKSIWINCL